LLRPQRHGQGPYGTGTGPVPDTRVLPGGCTPERT
jgi:hypothetical protein